MTNKWINHKQGPAPVPSTTLVTAKMANGDELGPMKASEFDWDFVGDIVTKYKIEGKS
jgi:hypothetical protein